MPVVFLALYFATAAAPQLLPITFAVWLAWIRHQRADQRRVRALRQAALHRKRERDLILALKSLP